MQMASGKDTCIYNVYVNTCTWARIVLDYFFEYSTTVVISQVSKVGHEKRYSISTSIIYKLWNNGFRHLSHKHRRFWRFSKTCSKTTEDLLNIFWKFHKIFKDRRRLPKTFEEDPIMHKQITVLSVKHDSEDTVLKISTYAHASGESGCKQKSLIAHPIGEYDFQVW